MVTKLRIHEGVIRPSLVAELEAFRAPDQRVSSYYLDLDPRHWANTEGVRIAIKNVLAEQRERLEHLDVRPAVRHALHRDWELVQEVAMLAGGSRGTRGLACFVASASGYGRALRLPWPVRPRAFFEDRFVLWPLRLLLEQADRYGVILTSEDKGRLFLYFFEKIEEVSEVLDVLPGRIRFPDPLRELEYVHKHVEHFHHHFEKVAEMGLRLWEWEPFEHLIIGARKPILSQFESHLHRYLRDRIRARWDIDVDTPTPQILERAMQEERQFLRWQAENLWKTIQDERPRRGARGPEEVFAALWQRRVQALLVVPDVERAGFRCSTCGRLSLRDGPCVECGGKVSPVQDVYEEAVYEAVEQSAQVRNYADPALKEVGSLAALKRF